MSHSISLVMCFARVAMCSFSETERGKQHYKINQHSHQQIERLQTLEDRYAQQVYNQPSSL